MRTNSIWAGMLAVGWAFGACAAQPASKPPAQWADYIAAVRKAEAIADNEARCLAHPDLPGNDWRPDTAKWVCSTLRKPIFSLDEIYERSQTQEGRAELERRFAELLDAHYKDQQQREQIFNAFRPFDDTARAGAVAKFWLERAPKSAFANAALASHHREAGWKARSFQLLYKISEKDLRSMSDEFALAVPLYLKALEIEPRLSPACTGLANIGKQSSDALQQYALSVCTKIDPDSYFLALERIYGAQPKWGGSQEKLRGAVAYAQARIDRNPRLAAVLGEGAGYAASMEENSGEGVNELVAAMRMGPSAYLAQRTGIAYRLKHDAWSSIAYLSLALRFRPMEADWRHLRAEELMEAGELEWAFNDMQVALQLQPDDGWHHYATGGIMRLLKGEKAARPYFKRAMDFPKSREAALAMYCQGLLSDFGASKEAGDCTRGFVAEYPGNGEGWRLHGWFLEASGAPNAELEAAFDQFIRYADPEDELDREAVAEIKQRRKKQQKPGTAGK